MTKYNIKSFTGGYTLVIMDPANPPIRPFPTFTRLPQKVDLTLTFHNGIIDADSNASLLRMIGIIEHDLKSFRKLISAHWFDKSQVDYLEKEFKNTQDAGHIIDSHTYPINYMDDLDGLLTVLKSIAITNGFQKSPNVYTPLLTSKSQDSHFHPAEQSATIKETGIVTKARKLFGCCFGY